ncbi:MAG: type II secretion system minor pseudopilin GspI [Pseudomonadota bacterium]
MISTRQKITGFTLVEVMLALVIVGLALSMIMTAMDRFTASAQLRDQTLAHWVALNQITEMRLQTQWPEVGDSNGTIEFASIEWQWVADVTETEFPELRRIDVEIFYPDDEVSLAAASGFVGQSRVPQAAPTPWGVNVSSGQPGNPNADSGQSGIEKPSNNLPGVGVVNPGDDDGG